MNLFYSEFFFLSFFFIFVVILAFIILLSSYFFGPSRPEIEKTVVYECGFDAYGSSRVAFDIRFYLVAMLFLIFDLETIIFLPWVVTYSFLPIDSFWVIIDFIAELLIGFVYAWQVGALNWD